MFRALTRLFRAFWYTITGRVDQASQVLERDPNLIRARYDDIAREKVRRLRQYIQAVAALVAQREEKKAKIITKSEEIARLTRVKTGAGVKVRQLVEKLQGEGKSQAEIEKNPEYLTLQGIFRDVSSSLSQLQQDVEGLDKEAAALDVSVNTHKVQLQGLQREIEKLKTEAHETVAAVITAQQEKEVAGLLAGIADDRTGEELRRLREMRGQVQAEAAVTREMAGVTDTTRQEAELADYATGDQSDREFREVAFGVAAAVEGPEERIVETDMPETVPLPKEDS